MLAVAMHMLTYLYMIHPKYDGEELTLIVKTEGKISAQPRLRSATSTLTDFEELVISSGPCIA